MEYGFAREEHRIFPPMVVVSIVNMCNLRCAHCYYPKFASLPDYEPRMMEEKLWNRICDEMADYPWSMLNLGTDGEPLLHKYLVVMLRYAREKGLEPINITTNGTLLKGALADAIVKEGLVDVINVSLDALSEGKYVQIRGARMHGKVYDNTNRIIELRDRVNAKLKIQVNIIDQPEVGDELDAFVAHWEPKVDNVLVRTYYDATHVTGGTGPNLTGKQTDFEPVERWPCQQFWRRINVSEDGTVRFCVDDWHNKSKIGDLHGSSLAEIWQGEAYEGFRELHLSGDFEKITYCAKCTEWQGSRWDYDYFTAMEKMLGTECL